MESDRRLFVVPCGSESAQRNFEYAVAEGVPSDELPHPVSAPHNGDRAQFWAVRSGTSDKLRNHWKKIPQTYDRAEGDIVAFYRNEKIVCIAEIVGSEKSRELADTVWLDENEGDPYQYFIFLGNVSSVDIPIETFNEPFRYEPSNNVRGFREIPADRTEKARNLYDTDEIGVVVNAIAGNRLDWLPHYDSTVWKIKPGKEGELRDIWLSEGIISIGWRDKLDSSLEDTPNSASDFLYPANLDGVDEDHLAEIDPSDSYQLTKFLGNPTKPGRQGPMKPGDCVVGFAPNDDEYGPEEIVGVGSVGGRFYEPALAPDESDRDFHRHVRWHRSWGTKVPAEAVDEEILSSLRSQGTLSHFGPTVEDLSIQMHRYAVFDLWEHVASEHLGYLREVTNVPRSQYAESFFETIGVTDRSEFEDRYTSIVGHATDDGDPELSKVEEQAFFERLFQQVDDLEPPRLCEETQALFHSIQELRAATDASTSETATDDTYERLVDAANGISLPESTTLSLDGLYFDDEARLRRQIRAALNGGKHIIFTGPPGTGKTELAREIGDLAETDLDAVTGTRFTTATSDWTTFDTVGGYMPDAEADGERLRFTPRFVLQCFRRDGEIRNDWLIVDELNRANVDKAFGQLFTVLSKESVELPYERESQVSIEWLDSDDIIGTSTVDDLLENQDQFPVTDGWRLIATMNTYDKASLYELSYAFMRRFSFINVGVPDLKEEESTEGESENDTLRASLLAPDWDDDNYPTAAWSLSDAETDALTEVYDDLTIIWHAVNTQRELGPAIVEDMIHLIADYDLSDNEAITEALTDAVANLAFPQLEGLRSRKQERVFEILEDKEFDLDTGKSEDGPTSARVDVAALRQRARSAFDMDIDKSNR